VVLVKQATIHREKCAFVIFIVSLCYLLHVMYIVHFVVASLYMLHTNINWNLQLVLVKK
jgi:hypothetical protein